MKTSILGSHGGLVTVTLTGTGLSSTMTVTVCGEPCTDLTIAEDVTTSATCVVPPSGECKSSDGIINPFYDGK